MSGYWEVIWGAVVIGGISTLGDFVWATWIPEHRVLFGLLHGTFLFFFIGLYFGLICRRFLLGAVGGAVIGLLAASGFYVLTMFLGVGATATAMLLMWAVCWLGISFLYIVLLRGERQLIPVLIRGGIAAAAAGIGFYMILSIWIPFNPNGREFALHFLAWSLVYFLGFAPVLLNRT